VFSKEKRKVFMGTSASQPILFSMLPKSRTPWSELLLSYGVQAVVIVIFIWIPILHPEIIDPPDRDYHAIELVPTPVPVNHTPQKQLPKLPVVVAKVEAPPPEALRLPAPQPKPKVQVEDTPAPQVTIAASKLEPIPADTPVIPKRLVRVNTFSTGSSAPQTLRTTPDRVQTGGFGDPNGIPAKASNSIKPANIAQSGGFDMPTGPGVGNGTGGAKGVSGVVASTGFGSGTAVADNRPASRGVVKQSGFGDADVAAPPTTGNRAAAPVVARMIPAEILSKPVPIYTEEARRLHVEGEVLVEAVLGASGKVQVLRVVRGLGHGLDEEAVRRAEQIHFKPASRDGQPADSTVVLHIIFQLA
jgi:TonB family protein